MNKVLILAFLAFLANAQEPFTFLANSKSGFNPPDEGLAVTETRFMSCVNGKCDLYTKPGLDKLSTTSLTNFYSSVRVGTTFDPRGFYDVHSKKMVFISTDGIRQAGSQVVIAVSKTDSPDNLDTDWWTYSFRASESDAVWADYPSVGYDFYNIYISVNMFTGTGKDGETDNIPRIWVIPKSELYSGKLDKSKDIPRKVHKISGHYTMVPATTREPSNKNMYVMSVSGRSLNMVKINNVHDYSQTTIEQARINIGAYYIGTYPNQKGGSATVNTGDWRPQSGYQFGNHLWLTRNSKNTDRLYNSVMWYKIDANTYDTEIGFFDHPEQDGALFYPALVPDKEGNVNFIMNGVDPDNYISSFVTSICANGTVMPLRLGKAGEAYFSSNRYGDYNAIALDPSDETTVWGAAEIPVSRGWAIYGVSFESGCNSEPSDKCPFDCGPNGECIVIPGEPGKCVCNEGFVSETCNQCEAKHYGQECLDCPDCVQNTGHEFWSHGKCNDGKTGDGTCACQNNWTGELCDECLPNYWNYFNRFCRSCPNCGDHGKCDDGNGSGKCVCDEGWIGSICHECAPGYYGPDCTKCPDCGDHGSCVDGVCVCDQYFTGETCNQCSESDRFLPDCNKCPADCGEGTCVEGKCFCNVGWEGDLCDHCNPAETKCDACNCGPNGKCVDPVTGECECNEGWALPQCENCTEGYFLNNNECTKCPDCGPNGECTKNGECQCNIGWTNDPNLPGKCNTCEESYFLDGDECLKCPDCTNHGTCSVKGRCSCDTGWGGALCDECAPGYYGPACAECPDCGTRGTCNDTLTGNGVCECEENWQDELCDECAPGYYGADCSPCPSCGTRGTCNDTLTGNGVCECEEGWSGSLCKMCEPGHFGTECLDCTECDQGLCRDSVCQCNPGWEGLRCGTCIPSNDMLLLGQSNNTKPCGDHGFCQDGDCICETGWIGKTCDTCTPENTSPDCFNCETDPCLCRNGVCHNTECECEQGWTGKYCDTCTEDNDSPDCPWLDCGDHGRNDAANHCTCDYGWEGSLCDVCVAQIVNKECSATI